MHRSRSTMGISWRIIRLAGKATLCCVAFSPAVNAQSSYSASWQGGSGNWSSAGLWQCSTDPPQCVPDGAVYVSASGGQINLDFNATVYSFDGTGTTTLSLSGTSLTLNGDPVVSDFEVDGGLKLNQGTVTAADLTAELQGSSAFANSSSFTANTLNLDGTLTVDSSTLSTRTVVIGNTVSGAATVTNSTWNELNLGTIILGQSDGISGSLTLGDGATVNMNTGGIVVGAGGQGTLTVGAGAVIASQTTTQIGIGDGQMSIAEGGKVTVASFLVGFQSPNSTLNVQGDGSELNLGGVAGAGMTVLNGTVTVGDKAVVNGGILAIGSGAVTVTEGASWTVSDPSSSSDLSIGLTSAILGSAGIGKLTISEGGSGSNAGDAQLGLNSGSMGEFLITGDDSAWTTGGAIAVGFQGQGSLTISDSGVFTSGANSQGVSGYIGQLAGSTGAATVEGDDSTWEAGGILQVGVAGTGTLTIGDEGEVHATDLSVGTVAGGKGTVTMTGGTLLLSGALIVGDGGSGTLTAFPQTPESGGPLDDPDIKSTSGVIGSQPGSAGSVTIGAIVGPLHQPDNSSWNISGPLTVGKGGVGTLDILGSVADFSATIAQASTSSGDVTVENGGVWTTDGGVIVGDRGVATLEILSGGEVDLLGGGAIIGNQSALRPDTVKVEGVWNMAQALIVSAAGSATLKVDAGGVVASGDGIIAQSSGSTGAATVTDAMSSWIANGTLTVGSSGTGTLAALAGAQISSISGTIGAQQGSTGTVTVSGDGSSWAVNIVPTVASANDGLLLVGDAGTATLNVSDGAQVLSAAGIVGNQSGSSGTVSLSGDGSQWIVSGPLSIGFGGTGSLSIAGAALSDTSAIIGASTGSVGSASVMGGGQWINSGSLTVAREGSGSLNVSSASQVSDADALLALNGGSVGSAAIADAQSQWLNSGQLLVAGGGKATVAISNGASVTSASGLIARDAGSTGAVTVDGTGSQWNNAGVLVIGSQGNATLSVTAGGTVSSTSAVIGDQNGSTGVVSVDGTQSSWAVGSALTVGNMGTGSLNITGGAQVQGESGVLGASAGSTGTVSVAGQGSVWQQSGGLVIGRSGIGSLSLSAGAEVTDTTGTISGNVGSSGNVIVTGSKSMWTNSGELIVGSAGSGTLTLSSGGTAASGSAVLGDASGATGAVSVDGSGSAWNAVSLVIGNLGNGNLTVSHGASVNSGATVLGLAAATKGSVAVSDGQWTTGDLSVGQLGSGSVTVNQGTVMTGALVLGSAVGASGNVDLQAGTWNAGIATIGDAGTATLNVLGGLTSETAVIGNQHNGTVSIGSGGSWATDGSLTVAAQGSGSLSINAGGSASVTGDVQIAHALGSTGSVSVSGGQWNIGGELLVAPGGAGTLTVQSGGSLLSTSGQVGGAAGSVASVVVDGVGSNWTATGAIGVGGEGGAALLMVSDSGAVVASQVNVGVSGTLAGQGVTANVINNGGTVTPTDGPGLMVIKGNYTQNLGTLLFDIDGSSAGQFDQLLVSGLAVFKGGKIEITFGNGFTPLSGEEFDLISATGGLTASNISFDVSGLPSGLKFDDTFGPNGLDLSFVAAPVPEPAIGLLYGSGLAFLVLALARRRHHWHPRMTLGGGSMGTRCSPIIRAGSFCARAQPNVHREANRAGLCVL